MLKLLNLDVLDATAESLLLTIDGQARGLRGNIAHAFQRRWPEAYEDFEAQLRFPLALGSAVRIDADSDCPWQSVIFISTLHHLETLDDDNKHEVIRRGLAAALRIAAGTGLTTLATAPLKGGWRLSVVEAYRTMRNVLSRIGAAHSRRFTGGLLPR